MRGTVIALAAFARLRSRPCRIAQAPPSLCKWSGHSHPAGSGLTGHLHLTLRLILAGRHQVRGTDQRVPISYAAGLGSRRSFAVFRRAHRPRPGPRTRQYHQAVARGILHAFRMQFSHIRAFSDSRNVQRRATKSDTSSHCLRTTTPGAIRSQALSCDQPRSTPD